MTSTATATDASVVDPIVDQFDQSVAEMLQRAAKNSAKQTTLIIQADLMLQAAASDDEPHQMNETLIAAMALTGVTTFDETKLGFLQTLSNIARSSSYQAMGKVRDVHATFAKAAYDNLSKKVSDRSRWLTAAGSAATAELLKMNTEPF